MSRPRPLLQRPQQQQFQHHHYLAYFFCPSPVGSDQLHRYQALASKPEVAPREPAIWPYRSLEHSVDEWKWHSEGRLAAVVLVVEAAVLAFEAQAAVVEAVEALVAEAEALAAAWKVRRRRRRI